MEDECLLDSPQRLSVVSSTDKPWRKRSSRDAPDAGRISVVSMTSQRTSMTEGRRSRSRNPSTQEKNENTLHFVYSDEVEKAMRSNFRCSAYPPISREGPMNYEPLVFIERLQDIHSDLVSFRRNRRFNLAREDSWKAKTTHGSYMNRKPSFDLLPHSIQGGPPSPGPKGKSRFSLKLNAAAEVFAKLREYQNRAAAQDEILISSRNKNKMEGACVNSSELPHNATSERSLRTRFAGDSLLPSLVADNNNVQNAREQDNARSPGLKLQRKTSVFLPPLIVTQEPSSGNLKDDVPDVVEQTHGYLQPWPLSSWPGARWSLHYN